jgi:membrane protein YdbS with pleckstrin-like domain
MEETPKIMRIHERLYFIVSVSYFFLAAATILFLIDAYFKEKDNANSFFACCIIVFIIIFPLILLFGFLSLKNWRSAKKGDASSIGKGAGQSFISLLLLSCPLAFFTYLWLISLDRQYWISIELIVSLFLILTVLNITIIVLYFTPNVRTLRQSLEKNNT